jgi:outer membrane protein assembly factor BamB
MSQKIVVSCPKCRSRLTLKNRANLGKRKPCPRCGHSFVVRASEEQNDSDQSTGPSLSRLGSHISRPQKRSQMKWRNAQVPAIIFALIIGVGFIAYALSGNTKQTDDATDNRTAEGDRQPVRGELLVERTYDSDSEISVPTIRTEESTPISDVVVSSDRPRETVPAVSTTSGVDTPKIPVPAANGGTSAPSTGGRSTDWYQWRGPKRDGVSTETGLLQRWPTDGPPLAWRVRGLGSGMSSVSISGGRLFTMGSKRGGQTHLICRNLSDGSEVWSTPIGGGKAPNCTPTVDPESGLVFGLTNSGDLMCVEAASGREVWRKNLGRDFGGRMMSGWGYSESPLIDGDRLVCTPGSDRAVIAALDKRTGRQIWATSSRQDSIGQAGKNGAGYSSIVIGNGAGTRQYVQLVGRGVIGVSAADGSPLWGYNRVANGTANVPTPVVTGDYVFCTTGYGAGGSALLQLQRSGRRIVANEVWYKRSNDLQNHHGGVVLVGSHLYFGHGHNNGFPVCVDLRSGRSRWKRTRGAGSGSAAVVFADGHLYFRYEDATMALIEAKPGGYNLKGKFRIGSNNGKSWPHPVIHDGRLYLRDQDELLCYNVRR